MCVKNYLVGGARLSCLADSRDDICTEMHNRIGHAAQTLAGNVAHVRDGLYVQAVLALEGVSRWQAADAVLERMKAAR